MKLITLQRYVSHCSRMTGNMMRLIVSLAIPLLIRLYVCTTVFIRVLNLSRYKHKLERWKTEQKMF